MKLELYEARGNIDKINASLLNNHAQLKKMVSVSPESEVYVDKLKDGEGKHTWKYVTNTIVTDESVAYVVVRSNKRQLMVISHDPDIVGEQDKYLIVWSQIALNIPEVKELTRNRDYIITSSDVNVQTKFYKTVASFVEYYKAKRNWDIIIVKKDKTLKDKRQNRLDSRTGMEIKPVKPTANINNDAIRKQRDVYNMYISGLKNNLADRLKKYSESRLSNISNIEDLKADLKNRQALAPKKLKIGGFVYNYSDMSNDGMDNNKVKLSFMYKLDVTDEIRNVNMNPVRIFRYDMIVSFGSSEVTKLRFMQDTWRNSGSKTFEEGLEYIKEIREELNNSQSNS